MTRNKYHNKKVTLDEKPIKRGNSAAEIIVRTDLHEFEPPTIKAVANAINEAMIQNKKHS